MAEFFAGGHLRFLNGEWRDDNGDPVEIRRVIHTKTELKPCPYCGGEAVMKIAPHIPHGYDYTPMCKDTSCCGRLTKKWMSLEVATYAWNRRASDGTTPL